MDKSYSFLSDEEPTDEQLEGLMQAVLVDVKERAAKADARFKDFQKQQLEETLKNWEEKYGLNKNKVSKFGD